MKLTYLIIPVLLSGCVTIHTPENRFKTTQPALIERCIKDARSVDKTLTDAQLRQACEYRNDIETSPKVRDCVDKINAILSTKGYPPTPFERVRKSAKISCLLGEPVHNCFAGGDVICDIVLNQMDVDKEYQRVVIKGEKAW